jgi:hypothetical protein
VKVRGALVDLKITLLPLNPAGRLSAAELLTEMLNNLRLSSSTDIDEHMSKNYGSGCERDRQNRNTTGLSPEELRDAGLRLEENVVMAIRPAISSACDAPRVKLQKGDGAERTSRVMKTKSKGSSDVRGTYPSSSLSSSTVQPSPMAIGSGEGSRRVAPKLFDEDWHKVNETFEILFNETFPEAECASCTAKSYN